MITREQYETEIGRLQDQIVKEQDDYNYHYNRQMVKPRGVLTTDTKYGNAMCKGGGNACWDHINRSANAWKNMQPGLTNKIESAMVASIGSKGKVQNSLYGIIRNKWHKMNKKHKLKP